ncbi:forespore capture DNA-binding protein RefZ [Sporolactobacillus vineae]|uniref:forespore capture DNA-binding protein RefZ n=1 Tax=Sporolactobacillus vineae TaxID=444463 RepID=UPI000289897A|nr:forespore capture DNA-binding protein RefZ [Sporolactobacillus vineae]
MAPESRHSVRTKSKEAVVHSALKLFNISGFDGTSVRAIAADAGVNLALVSYYFGGKQGLLEDLMASFFEGYLSELERGMKDAAESGLSSQERLIHVADKLIGYQQNYFYLSRFVHREMTLDNQLVRELMSSYLMKEKYLLDRLFRQVIHDAATDPLNADFVMLQYRDLITMPFMQPQYLREVYYLNPREAAFRANYLRYIRRWVARLTDRTERLPETGLQ